MLGSSAGLAGADTSSNNVLVTATVYTANGTSTDSVTVGALEANPAQCPTYAEQSMNEQGRQGFVDVQLPQNATWSLPTILSCLQTPLPLSTVTGVTVIAADGSLEVGPGSQLTPVDLAASGSDFANSSEYPVLEALGSVNQYDRPWRGQSDQDFLDEVQASQNDLPAPIAIEVFEGPHLTVTVNASRTTVPAGGTVSFSATVGGANGSALSYSWSFEGGAPSSTAPAPTATFSAAGRYDVTVQVTDAAGGGGGAEIPITVGAPPPAATGTHNQSGAGTSRKSHSPTGPRRSSGNHAGSSAGTHKSPSTTSGKGNTPTSTSSHTSTTPTSTTTSNRTTHPTNTTTPRTRTATSHRRAPRHPPSPIKPPARTSVSGPVVAGQLISDVTPLPPGVSPLVRSIPAVQASAPPARQAVRASAWPAVAGALAVALLLGLGAARELRGRRS